MTAIIYKSVEEKRAARQRMLEMKEILDQQMKVKMRTIEW